MGWYKIGDYPKEYNPNVHGTYDPGQYYGKPDVPFGQLKLCEVGGWFRRRNKSPRAFVSALSRAYWRWQSQYHLVRWPRLAPYYQVIIWAGMLYGTLNYHKTIVHQVAKYH